MMMNAGEWWFRCIDGWCLMMALVSLSLSMRRVLMDVDSLLEVCFDSLTLLARHTASYNNNNNNNTISIAP